MEKTSASPISMRMSGIDMHLPEAQRPGSPGGQTSSPNDESMAKQCERSGKLSKPCRGTGIAISLKRPDIREAILALDLPMATGDAEH